MVIVSMTKSMFEEPLKNIGEVKEDHGIDVGGVRESPVFDEYDPGPAFIML